MKPSKLLLPPLCAAALAAALLLPTQNSYASLTHRYSFDDTSGTTVTDSVGGKNGTVMGNVTISGGSATFPGVTHDDYIELPPGLISNYVTLTVEMWVTVAENGNWPEIFAFGRQTSNGEGANMVMLCPHSGSGDYRMSYAKGYPGYTDERVVNGVGTLDNLGPISVTCVYDPPNNSMSLYTNGAFVATLSPVQAGFSLANVVNQLSWLGRSLYNGDAAYNGTIEEFRVYNNPLSPLQIYANNAAGPDALVNNIAVSSLHWNVKPNMVVGSRQSTTVTFNTAAYGTVTLPNATEPTYASSDTNIVKVTAQGQLYAMAIGTATVSAVYNGTKNETVITVSGPKLLHRYSFSSDASDSVGNANGVLKGAATISGGQLVLPGGMASSDPDVPFVDLPNNLMIDLTTMTVECWITDNNSGTWARVWDFGNSAGGEDLSNGGRNFAYLCLPSPNNQMRGDIFLNDRGGESITISPVRPAVGQEAHVVWSCDIANQKSWLYLNGTLMATAPCSVAPADLGPTLNDWIGRSQYADPAWAGSVNEFRIYEGAVSPLQVSLNAASGPNNVVTDPGALQSISLSLGTNSVYNGGQPVQATLTADYASIKNVNVTTLPGVAYQSSDPSVLKVSSGGSLSGVNTGNATVTASFGGKTTTLPVAVVNLPNYAKATLAHRYSFNEAVGSTTVKDSAGTANGTIMGKGAAFDGNGKLSLPGGTSSNIEPPSDIAGYVDLPNGIISVMTNISVEAWITWEGSGPWQRIFDFGTSAGGEDLSTGNGNYLFMAPQGAANYMFSVRDPVSGAEPAPLISSTPLAAGQEIYLAVSYDYSDNVARLYSNAVSVVVGAAPIAINTIEDVNNWLGRSQWGDAMFQGKYNEFRIWNGPLMPSEISDHYAAGPDSIEARPKFTAIYLVPGNPPKIHVEWTGGGTLEVTPNPVAGPWQDTGYTSPVEVPVDQAQMFGRVKK